MEQYSVANDEKYFNIGKMNIPEDELFEKNEHHKLSDHTGGILFGLCNYRIDQLTI